MNLNRLNRLSGATLGFLLSGAILGGCTDRAADCNANLSCTPFGDSGSSGASSTSGSGGRGGRGGGSGSSGQSGAGGSSGLGGGAGSSGMSGDAGAAGAVMPACDGSLSPSAAACVISDDYGQFVSPDGSDVWGRATALRPIRTRR